MVMAKRGAMKEKPAGEFLATIYGIWMLRYVDVPENVVIALAHATGRGNRKNKANTANKYIPVVARVNGHGARTTLLPAGRGRYRMQVNADLRKGARAALKHHPKANKAFENAPPGLRRQILKWMDSAKSEPARMRRIETVIDRMVERAILGPRQRRQGQE